MQKRRRRVKKGRESKTEPESGGDLLLPQEKVSHAQQKTNSEMSHYAHALLPINRITPSVTLDIIQYRTGTNDSASQSANCWGLRL